MIDFDTNFGSKIAFMKFGKNETQPVSTRASGRNWLAVALATAYMFMSLRDNIPTSLALGGNVGWSYEKNALLGKTTKHIYHKKSFSLDIYNFVFEVKNNFFE
ncbi:MAG: hypothetical protein ACOWWR_13595 [Eubacteriales bacterium]